MNFKIPDIEKAFGWRSCPNEVTASDRFQDEADEETKSFRGLLWDEVPSELFDIYAGCFSYFTVEAFCYYLAGVLRVVIENKTHTTNSSDGLLIILELNPYEELWSERFLETWGILRYQELTLVKLWIESIIDNMVDRVGTKDIILDAQIDFGILAPTRALETVLVLLARQKKYMDMS